MPDIPQGINGAFSSDKRDYGLDCCPGTISVIVFMLVSRRSVTRSFYRPEGGYMLNHKNAALSLCVFIKETAMKLNNYWIRRLLDKAMSDIVIFFQAK